MEQGPEKSGCFWDLLRWSVGRHRLLRSRCTHSRQSRSIRQSAVVLIAFWGRATDCWNGLAIQVHEREPRSGKLAHPMPPVAGHPKQALVIRGAEITSVDRRLSCTSFSPIAQKMRDNTGTNPFRSVPVTGTQAAAAARNPTLIRRIHTSSSHHASHQWSDSAEK